MSSLWTIKSPSFSLQVYYSTLLYFVLKFAYIFILLDLYCFLLQSPFLVSKHQSFTPTIIKLELKRSITAFKFRLRAINGSSSSDNEQNVQDNIIVDSKRNPVAKFQEMISTLPPVVFVVKLSFLLLN